MEQSLPDIATLDDVRMLVNSFYQKVRSDSLIGPVFNEVITDQWPVHLEKMYRFWETLLLGNKTYFGAPFPPHAQLPADKEHFDTWLRLWYETVDESFQGPVADEAKWRADKMAILFLSKIRYYRDTGKKPIAGRRLHFRW